MSQLNRILLLSLVFFLNACSDNAGPTSPGSGETGQSAGTTYTLSVDPEPEEGGSVSPSAGELPEGTEIELTATPKEEWVFIEWGGNIEGSENPVTITVDSDLDIIAHFEVKTYPLSVNVEGQGVVSEQIVQQTLDTDYDSGTVVELTANPESGWRFQNWTGNTEGTDATVFITVDTQKSVTAHFIESGGDEPDDPDTTTCEESPDLSLLQPGDSEIVSFPDICSATLPEINGAVYRASLMSRANRGLGSSIPMVSDTLLVTASSESEQIASAGEIPSRTGRLKTSADEPVLHPSVLKRMESTAEAHRRLHEAERNRFDGVNVTTTPVSGSMRLMEDSQPEPDSARTFYASNPSGSNRLVIEAKLRKTDDHLIYYQDKEVTGTTDEVEDSDLDELFDYYNQHGKTIIDNAFGGLGPSVMAQNFADGSRPAYDIDENGRILLLQIPEEKMILGAAAYVSACDRFPIEENLATSGNLYCTDSNEAEVVFMLSPDDNFSKGMLVHEAKHISSHGYAIYGNRGYNDSWIEEGTAEIAMELSSRRASGLADSDRITYQEMWPTTSSEYLERYGMITVHTRAQGYLEASPEGSLYGTPTSLSENSHYYGASWLFHRYLADKFANGDQDSFFQEMNTSAPGTSTIENSTEHSMPELLDGFLTAIQVSGQSAWQHSNDRFESYDMADIEEGMASSQGNPGNWPWLFDSLPYQNASWEIDELLHGTPLLFEFQASGNTPLSLTIERLQDGNPQPVNDQDDLVLVITRIE
ncbi:MAG: hypothetical protein WD315_05700 [Balneolaceae bacterium]